VHYVQQRAINAIEFRNNSFLLLTM